MAGTAVTIRQQYPDNSEVERLRLSLNAVVVDLERIRAGVQAVCAILDADAGVTATNTSATANVATAATMTAYAVNTFDG